MLEWSEEKKPDGKVSRYNHVTAEAGPILFTIEWKGWKENDSRTLTASWRDGGGELFLGAHASTDTAKVAALDWLASIPVPGKPTHWAVYAPSGSHIGVWKDRDIARRIAAEHPSNTIVALRLVEEPK